MRTITMTELNQHVSAVTRRVIDEGEPVLVTKHGQVVLRLVPERAASPASRLEQLIAAGLAQPARGPRRHIGPRDPVPLSRSIDEILEEVRGDRI